MLLSRIQGFCQKNMETPDCNLVIQINGDCILIQIEAQLCPGKIRIQDLMEFIYTAF